VDVVVHRVNLILHVGIVFVQSLIGVASTFKFLAQVHQLIFFLPNLDLKFFDEAIKLYISTSFLVDSVLEVTILLFISLFKSLEVLKLIHKVVHLSLQIMNFCLGFSQFCFLVFLIVTFLVDASIHLFNFI
jgi:hypothetical protein